MIYQLQYYPDIVAAATTGGSNHPGTKTCTDQSEPIRRIKDYSDIKMNGTYY